MTCIVGLEANGRVYMGGDSMASDGWDQNQTALRKVFVKGDFIIGYTSSFRMGQLLQYQLEIPDHEAGLDDVAYLMSQFIPAVRGCLRDGSYVKSQDSREEGGSFLVGYRRKLCLIDSDFQVNRFRLGFDSVGCGRAYALGAAGLGMRDAVEAGRYSPSDAIMAVLEVMGKLSNGACPSYYVLERDFIS